MPTTPIHPISCDGCGQTAAPEHIARRLKRLELTTRYRPIHMSTLLLGGISPLAEQEFLYGGQFQGEANRILDAVGIATTDKSVENALSEFQRGGFFLTHLLECPTEDSGTSQPSREELLALRVPAIATRIRRSLKPKRVVLISSLLTPLMQRLSAAELGCPVILDGTKPFDLDAENSAEAIQQLRDALTSTAAAGN